MTDDNITTQYGAAQYIVQHCISMENLAMTKITVQITVKRLW